MKKNEIIELVISLVAITIISVLPYIDVAIQKSKTSIETMSEIANIMKDVPNNQLSFDLNEYHYIINYNDSEKVFDIVRFKMVNEESGYISGWCIKKKNLASWFWRSKDESTFHKYNLYNKSYYIDSIANEIIETQTELNEYIKVNFGG